MDQEQTELSNKPAQQDDLLTSIPGRMIAVILKPMGFFPDMPKTGGYVEPLVFMVVMAVLSALVMAIAGMIGFGPVGMMAMGFVGVIVVPMMAAIFGFVAAAIMFVIWKVMGSSENFETAYRCVAFSYAYAPVAALVSGIPYLGTLVSALWPMALLAIASIHVHGRSTNASWGVFGILGLVLALMGISAEYTGRQMVNSLESWNKQVEEKYGNQDEMTPEQAGKAVGDFLKGMQQRQQKAR